MAGLAFVSSGRQPRFGRILPGRDTMTHELFAFDLLLLFWCHIAYPPTRPR